MSAARISSGTAFPTAPCFGHLDLDRRLGGRHDDGNGRRRCRRLNDAEILISGAHGRGAVAYPVVGVNFNPERAALRLASVPWTVIDEDPFEPDTNFSPEVEPSVSTPGVEINVSCSIFVPAEVSVTLIASALALEKTSDAFSVTEALAGAVT